MKLAQCTTDPFRAAQATQVKARENLDDGESSATSSLRADPVANLLEQHLEKRVSHLFVQALLCYKSGYTFSVGKTLHQGFNATSQDGVKYHAAHSATIPCLYAKDPRTGAETVFLYRSPFYDESNATIDMVHTVNEADRAIDEKRRDSLLRNKAVALLNRASRGELSPEEVAKEFAIALLDEIDTALEKEPNVNVKRVLEFYREKAELLWSYVDEPSHIDRWLNLTLEMPEQGSPLLQKIHALPLEIYRERHERTNESRMPNHFYSLYYRELLARLDEGTRRTVEGVIALPPRNGPLQNAGRTRALLQANAAKIDALARDILSPTPLPQAQPLRPEIYRLRYFIIQKEQEIVAKIKTAVERVLYEVKATRINYLEAFFYNTLLEKRPALAPLLGISPARLQQKVRELRVSTIAHALLERHASEIATGRENLLATLRSEKECKHLEPLLYKRLLEAGHPVPQTEEAIDAALARYTKEPAAERHVATFMHRINGIVALADTQLSLLRTEKARYKRQLFALLRKARGMSQEAFIEEYKKAYPTFPMSKGTLYNLERGLKPISETFITQLCTLFGVHESLFG